MHILIAAVVECYFCTFYLLLDSKAKFNNLFAMAIFKNTALYFIKLISDGF